MNIFLSIDDTDNLDSQGSGQLSEILASELHFSGLASQCSNITRHQLFFHDAIPYTSHNSSMCFSAVIADHNLNEVIQFSKQFLKKNSAPGSDPGLCVAENGAPSGHELLISFGLKAKHTILTKQEAYFLAQQTGVHLSEHGGTGDGIIGALAGIGLRMHGSDGRVRGWLTPEQSGQMTTPRHLCSHPGIDDVVDNEGRRLTGDTPIKLTDEKVKAVFLNHRQVIAVNRTEKSPGHAEWATLSKAEVKQF